VSRPKRSSAEAWKVAETFTVDVLTLVSVPLRIGWESAERATDAAGLSAGVDVPGVGVPVRLGCALMVRSLPCVSMIA